jgi:hypothetical protein
MKVEWLLLHLHLLWSGVGIVALSALSWWKIGSIQKSYGLDARTNIGAATRTKISGQKMRLLRITCLTSVCLLMWLVITIVTAGTLEDWSRSSSIWLDCTLYETAYSRNWDAYDFEEGREVCSDLMNVFSQGDTSACTSACIFKTKPFSLSLHLICTTANDKNIACDCTCDDLVKIERPSVSIMTCGYLAQSMVVVLVGVNMGLRLMTYSFPDSKMHLF